MFESGMRIVGMPAAERATAASRPEKLEGRERQYGSLFTTKDG